MEHNNNQLANYSNQQTYKPMTWTNPKSYSPSSEENNNFSMSNILPKLSAVQWEDENTYCFQVEANALIVARRKDNNMVNGTKLLNVVGMTRGKRDGILKAEKERHVIKSGSMALKGVWIPFERAHTIAKTFKVDELLYPLFEKDIERFYYDPMLALQAHPIDIEISSQGLNKMLDLHKENINSSVNESTNNSHYQTTKPDLSQIVSVSMPERNPSHLRSLSLDDKEKYFNNSLSQPQQQVYSNLSYRSNFNYRNKVPTNLPPLVKSNDFTNPMPPLQSPVSYPSSYEYDAYSSQSISISIPLSSNVQYISNVCEPTISTPITQYFPNEQLTQYNEQGLHSTSTFPNAPKLAYNQLNQQFANNCEMTYNYNNDPINMPNNNYYYAENQAPTIQAPTVPSRESRAIRPQRLYSNQVRFNPYD